MPVYNVSKISPSDKRSNGLISSATFPGYFQNDENDVIESNAP